ncbi:mediator complex, subunit Med5 [Corynascus novoguineensis]|uniref:Mediator of RNA polymerase II transcription subunit 5 n=1 Tax=Corynascus novoguineensis TaxID=1126955 RepID=A0AAN7CXI8_9PEZI|nr:mediator complex, subunit Med5 [Corynascus novoguineensis]
MDSHSSKESLSASVAAWSQFVHRALVKRIEPDQFAAFLPFHFAEHPLPPVIIADVLLRPSKNQRYSLDPRVPTYLDALLKQRRVDVAAVLRALFKYSSAHLKVQPPDSDALGGDENRKEGEKGGERTPKGQKIVRWQNSYDDEEMILWRLAQAIHQGSGIKTAKNVVQIAKVLAKWMALFAEAAAAFSRDAFNSLNGLQVRDETADARTAFVLLLIAFSDNPLALATLDKPACKDICKMLSDALQTFIPCVMQVLPEMASRLELFRNETLGKYLPAEKKDAEVNTYMDNLIGMDSIQVPEVPVVNSRAGLYIYLSAALVGRPMVDDSALFAYLHNRYQGDVQSTAVQLILASFDLLANAVFRNEGPKTGHLLKSFVVNKVPLILVSLAATPAMYPFDPELSIKEALGQVDTNVFPTLSGMFEMSNTNSSFHDSVRQDFCFSCQLHGLLSQAAIENLLGDITYQSLPDEGRYSKDNLVQACLQDVDRTQKLIGELDNMNGNVGAAAQAIIEVIGSLCRNKETMTLKQLCSQLAAKPLSLDVLLLFDKPEKILHPLCELLDNWAGYEEDQGEYQPVYEEFGSILLLLLAFVYRYNLSPADLGIRSPDSFVGRLLSGGTLCRPLEDLSEQEKSHLNGWIHGLFDSEAGALGDDLMASCPPQDFYLLVPSLFQQIVVALSAGYLTDDMLKNGLEYLVDVLLLPSLVPAIMYLSNKLWVSSPQLQSAIIKILQVIIRPSSSSNEASAMLSSVLNIVAKPLEHALRSYQRQDPKSQEIEPLLRAIQENLSLSRRTGGADHTELESWCSTHANNGASPHSGLSAAVRHTIQSLVQWAQNPQLNGMPATYTHRQTLAAIKMLGAKRVLAILLDELRVLSDTPQAGIAYDVATALICAPDVTNDVSLSSGPRPAPSNDNNNNNNDANAGTPQNQADDPAASSQQQRQRQRQYKQRGRISLRDALKTEADDWRRTQKADPVMAETIVRLYRRVEAQMAPAPPSAAEAAAAAAAAAVMLQPPELGGLGGVPGDVGGVLGDAIAAAVGGEHHHGLHGHEGMVMDGSGGGNHGGGLDGAAAAAGGEQQHHLGGGLGGDVLTGSDLGTDGLFSSLSGNGSDFGADFAAGWDIEMS